MSDYIQKLSQIKKDIGIIQDSLFFEIHNLEQELKAFKEKLKATEERLGEAEEVIGFYDDNCIIDNDHDTDIIGRYALATNKKAHQYLSKYKEEEV